MNLLKYLENRIRGWLPKTPVLPHPQRKSPSRERPRATAKPDVTSTFDRRIQLSTGIILGLGIALSLVGLAGWFTVNRTYATLEKFFVAGELDLNYYLFRELIDQMAFYLAFMSIGAFALFSGVLQLKSSTARRLLFPKGPNCRLVGGLMGGGGALALGSLQVFFKYILISKYLYLQLFFVVFTVGAALCICGLYISSRDLKNAN